jgi:molecular chaperone DnaJ
MPQIMAAGMRDHYEVLGVARTATQEEIKSAFRRLAAQHHPDRNPGDPTADARFKELNAAFQVIGDPQRRTLYDRFGHRAEEAGSPFGAGGPFSGGVMDFSDIAVDGILGDLLGAFGIGRGERGDVKTDLEVSFEEAAFGCEKELVYNKLVSCTDCHGSGSAPGTMPETCSGCGGRGRVRFQQGILPIAVERICSKCKGSGKVVRDPCTMCRGQGVRAESNRLKVTIPPGVENGATRTVTGAGSRPRHDKPAGDLEITIRVREHPFFRRIGDDVVCHMPITFAQAALGGEIDVPTLDGKGRVRVPPGTQPGSVLRIKGRGIPRRGGMGRGDQHIEVTIEVPTSLTARQKELIETFAKEFGEDVQPQRKTFAEKLKELFG